MKEINFKQTEIGEIPEGWEDGFLENIADFKNGKSSPLRDENFPFPVFGSNGIIGYSEDFNSEAGTVVIGRVGSYCGSVYYSQGKCWVTDNAMIGKAKEQYDSEFLHYLLLNLNLNRHRAGSGQPLLNQGILNSIRIVFPTSFDEQHAIAKILSDLDAKIELNHQMNKTLESISQAIFKRWFVEFEFPEYEKIKFIDGLPEGWHSSKLGDFAEILNGFAFKSEDFANSGIFLLRTRNFTEDGYIIRDNTACLPESFYDEYKDFQLKKFDVLLVMVGASVGKMAMVQSSVLPALQNQNMWNFRSKSGSGQLFLNFLVKKIVQENMGTASGSARDFFRKDYFRSINFILPNEKILKDFDKQVTPIFDQIDKNLTESGILSQIRNSLLPRLMSGKMRIK